MSGGAVRLVQLRRGAVDRVAVVDEPHLRLLRGVASVHELAERAADEATSLVALIADHASGETVDYDAVYRGAADWRLLPPIGHPDDPARCLVSGTGLTHLGSASSRDAMHVRDAQVTDSMRMFRAGVEGGKPGPDEIGAAPEWFYKGNGTMLRTHGEPLVVPNFAEDGGEEAEIAGVYLIGSDGRPRRIGMCNGNEFADHVFEKRNYLHLASSKLRTTAIGPELVIDAEFASVPGNVGIERDGRSIWTKEIRTGEAAMSHSLRNLEHHHFKFDIHRRPGDVHVHFLGACSISFADGVRLADGDVMQVTFAGFGRPLRNPVAIDPGPPRLIEVESLA